MYPSICPPIAALTPSAAVKDLGNHGVQQILAARYVEVAASRRADPGEVDVRGVIVGRLIDDGEGHVTVHPGVLINGTEAPTIGA